MDNIIEFKPVKYKVVKMIDLDWGILLGYLKASNSNNDKAINSFIHFIEKQLNLIE